MTALIFATLLNGMAPLYAPLSTGQTRAASSTITLPAVSSNKFWYANWIMFVGESPGVAHQMFVQVGLIRRPQVDGKLHVFVAWQEAGDDMTYEQAGTVADGPHRFSIAQQGEVFSLLADGRTVGELALPTLARAKRSYLEIGPEVYAEGDRLSGNVLYAATQAGGVWTQIDAPTTCRYENHGTILQQWKGQWFAAGIFDRRLPSRFHGSCGDV